MFRKLAATIAANAHRYSTKRACDLALHRVRWAWERAGSYGCDKHLLDEAVWQCQLRWQVLAGIEWDAKFAAPSNP